MATGSFCATSAHGQPGGKKPAYIAGRFTLNGAAQPLEAEWGGQIKSVEHLLDTATPFFRVTFRQVMDLTSLDATVTAAVQGLDDDSTGDLSVNILNMTAINSVVFLPAAKQVYQLDLIVLDAGVAVDTDGVVVHVSAVFPH